MGLKTLANRTYLQAGTGIRVNRVTANDAVGPTTLFTVTGGPVLLTGLYGVVTTVRTGGAGATQVFTHTAVNLCIATITGLATVGTIISITGDPGDPLIIGVGTGVANTFAPIQGGLNGSATTGVQMFGIVLGVGVLTTTISIATTGATKYIATYIPLDDASALN
jgi:hypothetical protein